MKTEGDYLPLRLVANMYWDFTEFAKACGNKIGSGSVHEEMKLTLTRLDQEQERLSKAMVIELKKCAPPEIIDWAVSTPGIGLPSVAKLLGLIGDPCMAYPKSIVWEDGVKTVTSLPAVPRNVAKLWAYCGVGDPARQRRNVGGDQKKAMALGNPKAKATIYVMAQFGAVMNRASAYRPLYDEARALYGTRLHTVQCQTTRPAPHSNGCGTRAHPELGAPGSPWRDGHAAAAAKRKVCKEILRDLWEVARDAA
jgi:hypothetical protein